MIVSHRSWYSFASCRCSRLYRASWPERISLIFSMGTGAGVNWQNRRSYKVIYVLILSCFDTHAICPRSASSRKRYVFCFLAETLVINVPCWRAFNVFTLPTSCNDGGCAVIRGDPRFPSATVKSSSCSAGALRECGSMAVTSDNDREWPMRPPTRSTGSSPADDLLPVNDRALLIAVEYAARLLNPCIVRRNDKPRPFSASCSSSSSLAMFPLLSTTPPALRRMLGLGYILCQCGEEVGERLLHIRSWASRV